MPEYQLQIKQVVDYPRCRIYREFIHKLINDRSIRINGGSGLFHFTVLCSYANFRTSYRRIDGISYTVSPGEWVCTVKELSCWFRTRFHRQALSMLDTLQKQHLISYTLLGRGNVVKYKILHWARHNSALEYNAPCQKDTGFFFLPVAPTPAYKLGSMANDPLKMYLMDIFTVPLNLAGLPGISIPCGRSKDNMPIGMQFIGRPLDEETIIRAAYTYEVNHDYANKIGQGVE